MAGTLSRSIRPLPVSVVAAALVVAAVLVVVLASSCAKPLPTYNHDVAPIFEAKCAGCHRAGGIGPMPLTTYDDVTSFKDQVRSAIDRGLMPPWLPAKGCNTYSNDYSLSDDDKATLAAWFDADLPRGDGPVVSASALKDPKKPAIRYDRVFDAASEPYTPTQDDDYRCYAIPWPYATTKYITGFDMLPGDASNVHHVNIYLNPPASGSQDTDFVALDDADPAPGFSCDNGDRNLSSTLVGAWAPGASGTAYPAGSGQLVEPGSSITLEVHYAHAAGALPDSSQLALELADSVEHRGIGVAFYDFADWPSGGMTIPAHQVATHDIEMDPSLELAVVAPWITAHTVDVHVAALHMHALGTKGQVAIHSDEGDRCLLEIPRWDFHWQMGYSLSKPEPLILGQDKLYLSCTWDNTAGDVDVNWGPRTRDEMCIGFLYLVPEQ